ncbi:hypothetical protein KY285_015428 [Solanum tuberosum]|nr:hypothetical protein KY285_015428 [Solanum tuberosum]
MAKKKERSVNVSGKPKHSLDSNRDVSAAKNGCSAATVRRLKIYNTRPKRNPQGHIIKHDLQSKELPSTRIQPDRRWFDNTRVVNQKELEFFREELQTRLSSNYNVILKERKLPMSLLNDHQKQVKVHLLDNEPFADAFGPKTKRKRPKLMALDYEALVKKDDVSHDGFEDKHGASTSMDENADGFRDLVWHTMFEKGQSKRIWSELYKVIDSSDVVVQVLDARDPCGTRCYHLEKHLKENCKHKHMVLLLNKGSLLSVLRQFSRLKSDKQAISVGFIGYPNVGKSSVINTLRTKNVCKVAPIPGETKVWQAWYVSSTLLCQACACDLSKSTIKEGEEFWAPELLSKLAKSCAIVIFRVGYVRVTNLPDASEHISEVLNRVDEYDFLQQLYKSTGKLLKGGEPDYKTAAKMVLHDTFFVPPPKLDDASSDEQNELVTEADTAVDCIKPQLLSKLLLTSFHHNN